MSDVERFQLDRDKAVLLVVDVQERLVVTMDPQDYARMRDNIRLLVEGVELMGIPVVFTEQYPRGLGHTVSELQHACQHGVVEKVSFGCCGEPSFLEKMRELGKTQVLVTGMEAHICVYQTVLGLLEEGYHVHLVRDGIISRNRTDQQAGEENAVRAGAVATTVETALFQLMQESTTSEFKAISNLIKHRGQPVHQGASTR